jgi:hypothetical protein
MILIQSVLRFLRRKPDQPAQPGPDLHRPKDRPEDKPAEPGQDKDRERKDQDRP